MMKRCNARDDMMQCNKQIKHTAKLEIAGSLLEHRSRGVTTAPLDFIYRGNIELYECRVKIWNYSWFVWPFYTLIEFLGI